MLYYDPTESRLGTRLPDTVIRSGTALPGLEKATGADFIISPLSEPKLNEITNSKPSQIGLRKHTEAGLLVQRKSGLDLISSIPDLSNILAKMLDWTAYPWLLIAGEYKINKRNKIVVGERETEWEYNAFLGALEDWQLHGGYYSILCRDGLIGPWVARWHDKVNVFRDQSEKLILPRKPTQVITVSNDSGNDMPWRATLASFPGIGIETATTIANYCGTLADSLVFLSDQNNIRLKDATSEDGKNTYPKNVGLAKLVDARQWLGLEVIDGQQEVLTKIIGERVISRTKEKKYRKPTMKGVASNVDVPVQSDKAMINQPVTSEELDLPY